MSVVFGGFDLQTCKDMIDLVLVMSAVAMMLIDFSQHPPGNVLSHFFMKIIKQKIVRKIVHFMLMISAIIVMFLNIIHKENIKDVSLIIELLRVFSIIVFMNFAYFCKKEMKYNSDKNESTVTPTVVHIGTGVSSCCKSGIPQYYRRRSSASISSLSSMESSTSDYKMNIKEELKKSYVESYMQNNEDVPQGEVIKALQYLDSLPEGIASHRSSENLMNAIYHIECMQKKSRLDEHGLPVDYSEEELLEIIVEDNDYSSEDFDRVVENFFNTNGFLPSPKEFVEIYDDMKGIVQLEKEIKETKMEIEDTRKEMGETQQQVVEARVENERLRQVVHHNHQTIQQKDQTIQQKDQTIQQKDQALQQKNQALWQKERVVQEKDKRIRYLEEKTCDMTEGAWQCKIREMEEKIRLLEIRSTRSECKICKDAEVQVVFKPCGHTLTCEKCYKRFTNCPMCRVKIQGTTNIILA